MKIIRFIILFILIALITFVLYAFFKVNSYNTTVENDTMEDNIEEPFCPFSEEIHNETTPEEDETIVLEEFVEEVKYFSYIEEKPVVIVNTVKKVEEEVKEEPIVEEENNPPVFTVSPYNRNALIHLLYFEACSCNTKEDILEQRAIISVVFNRLNSQNYEHCYDVSDIIFFKYPNGSYAFTPAENKDRFWNFANKHEKEDFERNYNQLAEKVDYVINCGCTVPSNVLYFVSKNSYNTKEYFRNNHKVFSIYDDTVFMTIEKP